MKIDEFKDALKPLAYTITDTKSGIISIYTHNYWGGDNHNEWCFQLAPDHPAVIVNKQYDKLDGMPLFCLRDLLNLIAELEKTPVNERFPEKKYRLRWISDDVGSTNYLYLDDYIWHFTDVKSHAGVFTESKLDQLKKDNPRFAPAIDAMKEPVEGKDDDND